MVVPRSPPVRSCLWIFGGDIQNQTQKKKIPKDYRKSRRKTNTQYHMYSTPVTVVPVSRNQQVLSGCTAKKRSTGRSSRSPGNNNVADLRLTVKLWPSIWRVRTRLTPRFKLPRHMLAKLVKRGGKPVGLWRTKRQHKEHQRLRTYLDQTQPPPRRKNV